MSLTPYRLSTGRCRPRFFGVYDFLKGLLGADSSFRSVHPEALRILHEEKWGHCGGGPSIRDFLTSQFVKGVIAFIDGLRRLRGFSRLRAVPVLGNSVQNLHLVGHDFDCRALFAFRAFPLSGL
jgi:hypothetical protein